jgi:hypothetical protein
MHFRDVAAWRFHRRKAFIALVEGPRSLCPHLCVVMTSEMGDISSAMAGDGLDYERRVIVVLVLGWPWWMT